MRRDPNNHWLPNKEGFHKIQKLLDALTMMIDPIQAEYDELWKEFGIDELPQRNTPVSSAVSLFVQGAGNPKAKLLFVGDFYGQENAEQLLIKIIEAMGYTRAQIYLVNILKPSAVEQCGIQLKMQINAVQPKVVIALGETSALLLSGMDTNLTQLRGKWLKLYWDNKIDLLPTFSPSYLLDNPSAKKLVWEDMKLAQKKLSSFKD